VLDDVSDSPHSGQPLVNALVLQQVPLYSCSSAALEANIGWPVAVLLRNIMDNHDFGSTPCDVSTEADNRNGLDTLGYVKANFFCLIWFHSNRFAPSVRV
jgi:hypothetical protein